MITIAQPPIRRARLENGLTVVVASRPGVPLAAVRLVLAVGAALDPAHAHGLAGLDRIEHAHTHSRQALGVGRRQRLQTGRRAVEIGADDEALVDSLVSPGHPSTPGYNDPAYPLTGRPRQRM